MKTSTKFFFIVFVLTIVFTLGLSVKVSISHAKSWTDNWTLNGVPLNKFKHTTTKEKIQLGTGVITSLATHAFCQLAYLEMNGADWHMEMNGIYPSEIYDSELSNKQAREFALAGMIGQLVFGTFLNLGTKKGNMFVTGYNIGSFIEISSYPLLHSEEKSDFNHYEEKGGNKDKAYFLLTAWSTFLMVDYK